MLNDEQCTQFPPSWWTPTEHMQAFLKPHTTMCAVVSGHRLKPVYTFFEGVSGEVSD